MLFLKNYLFRTCRILLAAAALCFAGSFDTSDAMAQETTKSANEPNPAPENPAQADKEQVADSAQKPAQAKVDGLKANPNQPKASAPADSSSDAGVATATAAPQKHSAKPDKATDARSNKPSGEKSAERPSKDLAVKEDLAEQQDDPEPKSFIGAIAMVLETQSKLLFQARVDTGAHSCSIHTDEFIIDDPAETMQENVGKPVRIKLVNHEEQTAWVDARISRLVKVKTSERSEKRYAVSLTLAHDDREKEVGVTLNDRSHMKYPLLLGRNFLSGDFVVDVTLPDQ